MTESLDMEDVGMAPFRSGRRTSKLAIVGAGVRCLVPIHYSSDPAELERTAGSVLTSVGSAPFAPLLLRRSTK